MRSYGQALVASRRLGRAGKLRRRGQAAEALAVAQEGLALLAQPVIVRDGGPELSALVCLTTLVEQLAHELQQPGASDRDLQNAFEGLRDMGESRSGRLRGFRAAWLPYLEQRVGTQPRSGSQD
jgi:hypothetical protein